MREGRDMRGGLGLAAAGAVIAAALAGCGSGGSSASAAPAAPTSAAATLTWAQRDCEATTAAVNDVAGPVEQQDAAGVVRAGQMAQTNVSLVEESLAESVGNEEITNVAGAATDVLAVIEGMASEAAQYENDFGSWSSVTDSEQQLASYFKSLEQACSAAGAAISGSGSPVTGATAQGGQPAAGTPARSTAANASPPAFSPSTVPNPYSVGCPTSAQLLAAWNAAPAAVRDTWIELRVTGFSYTTCWQQWVVTNPITDGNGTVIFTRTDGQLAVFPETELSKFDAAICRVPGIRAAWATPAMGPASCS